jgi:hypothetical protein
MFHAITISTLQLLRPRHFDVDVCVIPPKKLDLFGAKKSSQNKTSGGHKRAWTGSRGSLQTLYMIIRDQVQQTNI